MASKEQYYFLDEIGLLGSQDRTEAQVRRDGKRMDDYIKGLKAGKTKLKASRAVKRRSKSK
mgnify:CR=1 FL=1